MILDLLMFITHSFLMLIKRANPKGIVLRSLNIVSVMIANILVFLFSVVYMFLISLKLIGYSRPLVVTIILLLWLMAFIGMRWKYRNVYSKVIKKATGRYPFSDRKITVLFFVCFLTSFIIVGFGVLCFRMYFYG